MENLNKIDIATQVTDKWLLSVGFIAYGVEYKHPKLPHLALVLQETSETLGQLIDFYIYTDINTKKQVYSAYYLNTDDFLSEHKIE